MKLKRVEIVLALIVLITLAGCDRNGPASESEYHRGTEGIVFNFMRNSPPSEVFEGDSIPFAVEVRNKGADSTSPRFWLSGHDENIIHLNWQGSSPNPGNLEARDENNPIGGYATLESNSVGVSLPNDVDSYETTMRLTACYPYTTFASTQLCVDPDPTINADDTCTSSDVSVSGGQGGPVAITHVQEESSRDKVRFVVTIQNVGGGTVIDRGKVSSCTTVREQDMNKVHVSAQSISGRSVNCRPNPVRIVGGKGIAYCETSMSGGTSAFTTVLTMNLDYGYKSSITKSIKVRRI